MANSSALAPLCHAFVLHSRPYREKSRLVDIFTLEHGLIRGVMRQQIPPLFQPCVMAWRGKNPLKTISQCESVGHPLVLEGNALFSGFYLNELLVRLLADEESHSELFVLYTQILAQLNTTTQLEPLLRRFELCLLTALGYAINFTQDILVKPLLPLAYYQYQLERGFIEVDDVSDGGWQGQYLLAIAAQDWTQAQTRQAAKYILRTALAAHLGNKPLKSRELMTYAFPQKLVCI
ncbi:MAG: DNA repair protein RecO [Moraxellaceae bacterium]|nr:DNA repair protein RecO [Moraxellaceae bacterium]MBK8327708.1 DNA repair protein RecO [Moraxellaceae bacterium]